MTNKSNQSHALSILSFLLLLVFCLGFRVYSPKVKWNIENSSGNNTIWLRFCRHPSLTNNDVGSTDPLYGSSITFDSVIDSILNDYTSVSTSFIQLKDGDRDANFASSNTTNRIIDVCFEDMTIKDGYATPKIENNQIIGCDFKVNTEALGSAKRFLRVATHELGHCFGLDHSQDTTHSVMSYFANGLYRLQDDDKMALTYLYPEAGYDENETATYGTSCAPR